MSLVSTGTTLARYEVLGKLATGGMSELYLARQTGPLGFHKILVLKVILPHLAEDTRFLQMFENEAKLAALLNHPGVVQVYDFGVDQGMHYLAMEYIDGLALDRIHERLRDRQESIPVPLACRIVSDVCSALEYAHSLADASGQPLQIMHRDVSLENILITYTGQVKLVDFGLAKARTMASATTQGRLKGKYRYMAPEMLIGAPDLDHRIDIFALGVVIYALLTNKMPFSGKSHRAIFRSILERPPVAPRQRNPELSLQLESVILRALEKERTRRYQRAKEMQDAIEACIAQSAGASTYHLSQFMAALFPPGTDPGRLVYQQLAGVHTPHRQVEGHTSVPLEELPSSSTLIIDEPTTEPRALPELRAEPLSPAQTAVTVRVPVPDASLPAAPLPDVTVKTARPIIEETSSSVPLPEVTFRSAVLPDPTALTPSRTEVSDGGEPMPDQLPTTVRKVRTDPELELETKVRENALPARARVSPVASEPVIIIAPRARDESDAAMPAPIRPARPTGPMPWLVRLARAADAVDGEAAPAAAPLALRRAEAPVGEALPAPLSSEPSSLSVVLRGGTLTDLSDAPPVPPRWPKVLAVLIAVLLVGGVAVVRLWWLPRHQPAAASPVDAGRLREAGPPEAGSAAGGDGSSVEAATAREKIEE